ncbi:MAG: family 16 glycosylhydrolase [Bacillota bacterium]
MKTIKLIISLLLITIVFGSNTLLSNQVLAQNHSHSQEEKLLSIFSGLELKAASHRLGRGRLRPDNIKFIDDILVLSSPNNSYHGAEVRTIERLGYGTYSAIIKSDYVPGSFTAFFLYQDLTSGNDEIDIEIHNDGSRHVDFVTFKDGVKTNKESKILDFDPTADYYKYSIDYQPEIIRFYVEGKLLASFKDGLPAAEMKLMINHWWPVWLDSERRQPASEVYLKAIEVE